MLAILAILVILAILTILAILAFLVLVISRTRKYPPQENHLSESNIQERLPCVGDESL